MRPKIGRTGKKLAITGGETGALSDDDDVPDLLSPSESSDEENDDDSDSGEDFDDLEDNNSEYDSEEEEELKRMFNQVMDAGEEAIPELIQTWAEGASASKSPQSAKKAKNPFVKLLGRLAGTNYVYQAISWRLTRTVVRSHVFSRSNIKFETRIRSSASTS